MYENICPIDMIVFWKKSCILIAQEGCIISQKVILVSNLREWTSW